MQSDEEVGKIALATPILISKALELFMRDLIQKTSDITRTKNAKVMTVSHLKICVKQEENFDFLTEIVEKVPDIEPEKTEKRGRPKKVITSSGGVGEEGEEMDDDEEEDEEDEEEEEESEEKPKPKKQNKLEKIASNASAKNKLKPVKKEIKKNNVDEEEEEESGSIQRLMPKQNLPQQYQHVSQQHFPQSFTQAQFTPYPPHPGQLPQYYTPTKGNFSQTYIPNTFNMPVMNVPADPKNSPQRRGKLSEILCTDSSEFNPDDNLKGFSVLHKQ